MTNKERFIVGNWKMNLSIAEATQLATDIKAGVTRMSPPSWLKCWVAPAFLSLASVCQVAEGSSLEVGSQNICENKNGAFTGEISAEMLKDVNASFAIVGHSERRTYYNETDQLVAVRAKGALQGGITPIVCIGENLEEREAGLTDKVLRAQLAPVLELNRENLAQIIFAYEPKWAIGTGRNATPEMITETHTAILEIIGLSTRGLLYGGSVTPDNVASILESGVVDGALVGGASLKAESYLSLVSISKDIEPCVI